MRNLVFVLFLGVFGFVVAGWFLDWYSIAGVKSDKGQHRVQIDFDTEKIREDLARGKEKLGDTIHKVQDSGEDDPAEEPALPQKPTKPKKPSYSNPALRPNAVPNDKAPDAPSDEDTDALPPE